MQDFTSSLETETPRQGLDLAARISWEIVKMVQPSNQIRDRLLAIYEDDAESILTACQIVAVNFQTIAAANGYWSKMNSFGDKPM
ncbi:MULTISPECIES: hexameric tyrosine-coordinated heme protein [unclassified Rhizobium]|uniref:hexameric tyrosine-coordinated heme protein n=1 Tax=unclassified Rhizobium TaxID=2613769 RepID=UPI00160BA31A|nr:MULTISPECIES: hexameric tyrosine-coordinated heme protein [unclassified Rhizobium]MBB3543048.1 hypothetical protein [Rhizobium sp. BK399]MCS3742265.1 hypothetical protein [Rhizobium sp. BK661]